MKKISVLAMLALVLVLGLTFVGCDNETTKEVPNITEFYSRGLSSGDPITSFTTDQEILFTAWYTSPYHDLARFVVFIKKGGVTQASRDMVRNENWGNTHTNISTRFTFGSWRLSAGSYTAELYAEDVEGNRSNTVTTSFTVQ